MVSIGSGALTKDENMEKKSDVYNLIIICVFSLSLVIYFTYRHYEKKHSLRTYGVKCKAFFYWVKGGGDEAPAGLFRFSVDKVNYQGSFLRDQNANSDSYSVGDTIEIVYLPSDPNISDITINIFD